VYGVLLNFRDEAAAWTGRMQEAPYKGAPRAPVLYVKTANTRSGNGASIAVPREIAQVEVGATIGMVMGPCSRPGVAADPMARVAGYVLLNDLSIPHDSYYRPPVKFKCLDGFLGIGSRVVDPVVTGDPAQLSLEVRVNGQVRQTLHFTNLVRSAAQLLADVSEFMTLQPGDVLMLGCDAHRPLVGVGDSIAISAPGVDELGVLTNTMVAA
jgi:5-oxopent-3-ene-1,2,5-tricarboxylate decarboxylase/2-hydroxyhepta-2,4-diene-1,7-dioate isomerase